MTLFAFRGAKSHEWLFATLSLVTKSHSQDLLDSGHPFLDLLESALAK